MRDASSGASSDFISFEVDESFDVTQKTVYLLAVLSSSLHQTRESPKRISREEESIEERSKISPYVALLSETDNILWYTPIEGRISSFFLYIYTHTHTHILSVFYFSFLRRCSLCQFTTFFFRVTCRRRFTQDFYSGKPDAFSGPPISDCSRFKTVLQ